MQRPAVTHGFAPGPFWTPGHLTSGLSMSQELTLNTDKGSSTQGLPFKWLFPTKRFKVPGKTTTDLVALLAITGGLALQLFELAS